MQGNNTADSKAARREVETVGERETETIRELREYTRLFHHIFVQISVIRG